MSKNVIFEALAFLEGYKPSPSMQGMESSEKIKEAYIKNAVISLISIKQYNPKTDVGIVINFDIEEKWRNKLESQNIIIWKCPFREFHMPPEIVYSLSYYKLCAFYFLLNNTNYEKYCFIDCDTIAVANFAPVWEECEDAFLIVPNDEGMDQKVRKEITELYSRLNSETRLITHYASGFIIGTRNDLIEIIDKCKDVYSRVIDLGAKPAGGDEIIWSLVLADASIRIYSPKVYCLLSNIGMKEYWVDKADYHDPHIIMWHLPTEKRYALIWAYEYYEKKCHLPDLEIMAKACRIRVIKNRFNILSLKTILSDSTVIKRNLRKLMKG